MPPPYQRGRVEPPNLDHLRKLSWAKHAGRIAQLKATVAPPATWDSVELGFIGPIKDQSQCGSCWDFSGTCVVEVANNVAGVGGGPATMILSEQYTLDCGSNGGCGGDDNTTVLAWAEATGLPLTSAYGAYAGSRDKCTWVASEQLFKVTSWGFADSAGGQGVTSDADIQAAIMAYGCVGAAIAANGDFENMTPGTVFQGGGFGQNDINHNIALVGWKPNTTGTGIAWKLRNSWGTSWCDAGYCYIASGANQVGNESVFAFVTPLTPPGPTPTPAPTPTPTPTPSPTLISIPSGIYTFSGGTFTPAVATKK